MGYYTQYYMQIFDTDGTDLTDLIEDGTSFQDVLDFPEEYQPDVVQVIKEIMDDDDSYYGITSEEPCKWYDHDENMMALSKKYPNLVLYLYGVGEENNDVWCAYYYNGKMQKIQPVLKWPDFDIERFVNE